MGVDLNCESKGWQAEPWVIWLEGEGKLLSAGPTETVRGPDGLYTVSSRVTVEKRHRNSFTCRVQQNHTNQIREAKIYIAGKLFVWDVITILKSWGQFLACYSVLYHFRWFLWGPVQFFFYHSWSGCWFGCLHPGYSDSWLFCVEIQ